MKKRINMQDIADRLNISKNSVSQALSGKSGVSEETRRKVIQTAEEMGYRYTQRRPSRSKTIQRVGVIVSEAAFDIKSFFGDIYLSIEREAQRHGIRLVLQSITADDRDRLTLPSFVQDKSVDGILILSPISTEYINKVIDQGIPTVLIDHHHPGIAADAVLTNNRFGAYKAVKYLLDLDHERVAVIGDVAFSSSYQERWEGYKLAMREHGIEPRSEWMFIDVHQDQQTIEELLTSLDDIPEAWFCLSDGYSYYVCSTLKKMGYHIPDDISIFGFDNNVFSQISDPKITTMEIDLSAYANKAFSQLMWRVQHPDEVHYEIHLPARLIERDSTARSKFALKNQ
ncbi:LacI family DNA-binding transcriptional regulator [Insulibacter thermoxylanivorax]|nr:LacI family DNA-binding transcriptional regulator [Insulibacter thermoxylanivorax]